MQSIAFFENKKCNINQLADGAIKWKFDTYGLLSLSFCGDDPPEFH